MPETVNEQSQSSAGRVTVSFLFGKDLVPGLPEQVVLDVVQPITAAELLLRLEQMTGVTDLRAKLTRYYVILVNGTTIQHLQGWETPIEPGVAVAIVAPMGGGRAGGGRQR